MQQTIGCSQSLGDKNKIAYSKLRKIYKNKILILVAEGSKTSFCAKIIIKLNISDSQFQLYDPSV